MRLSTGVLASALLSASALAAQEPPGDTARHCVRRYYDIDW